LKALRNFIEQIGPRRAMLMGGVAAALLLSLGWMALRTPSSEMGFLYTDLEPAAAKAISDKLNAQGVPFQISADGTSVMAPVAKLAELRMAMAGDQLGGKVGYEVLDGEQPFGISASRAKLNETRAIEGELAKSIESLERVSRARVHIVMPERAMFETERRKATASVSVKTTGRLAGESVQAIRQLVASAVPGLSPESVAVVDQSGALLARAGDGGDAGSSEIDERQATVEAKLRSEVEGLVTSIVGTGKVRASVSAVLERDEVREQAETFDPDLQVVARQVTVESGEQSNENAAGAEGVTVATQLPENEGPITGEGGESRRSARNETSEDITYQNSRTEKLSVRSPGRIARLTVAVMVDGGPKRLQPAEVQRIQRLVENAVGFDAERGDSVVVENMSFVEPDEMSELADVLPFGLTIDHLLDFAKFLVIGGVILFAVRMLRPRIMAQADGAAPALLAAPVEDSPEMLALAQRAADGDEEAMRELQLKRNPDGTALDEEIALAEIDGRIKLSALRRIGDVIAAGPAESASVIRQWMNS
jgi:flagellar M-ring protein FliF